MSDLISGIVDFFKALLGAWKLALLLVVFCCTISTLYWFIQKPKYEASASFILEEKSAGIGGGLSGLASQFGVDLGGLSGGAGLFAGDNILDILKSRTIIEKTLLSKVDSAKGAEGATLADLFLESNQLKEKWAGNENLSKISFAKWAPGKVNSRLQDSVMYVIYQKLYKKNVSIERLNKKGSIITVSTNSPSEVFSKLFTERLVAETLKMYIDIKTGNAVNNIRRLENRSDSLLNILNAKSFKSASLQVLDANIAYKTTAVPVEVSQREKSVSYALYTEVIKNLEASRMALAGQTPIINLLDNPRYPLDDSRKSFSLLFLMGMGAGLALFFVIVFFKY